MSLSPSIEAETDRPAMKAGLTPSLGARPTAIGVNVAIPPIDDPIVTEKRAIAVKMPGIIHWLGIMTLQSLIADSTPPDSEMT